jgi:hypothetical protein
MKDGAKGNEMNAVQEVLHCLLAHYM